VTERALSLALQESESAGLLLREVLADRRPPATLYQPLPAGQRLVADLSAISWS
jgi:DNA-binding HxlR family transcriptional regulator